MPATPIIATQGLTKRYGSVVGIQDLALEVYPGELFGFLGPNAAGKTTTIQLIAGFLRPTRGSVHVLGKDPWSEGTLIWPEVGFLPDSPALYEHFSGAEILDYLGGLQGRLPTRRNELLERLNFSRKDLDRPIKTYSRGMRQKVAIVQALQHDPQLIIMDEPTEGLDPLMQQALFTLLRELRERGRTIFMSSHILSDVERLCDRVGIVRAGRLVAVEPLKALRDKQVRRMSVVLGQEVSNPFTGHPCVLRAQQNDRTWHLQVQGDVLPLLQTLARLPVEDLVYEPAHLEDVFLAYYRPSAEEKGAIGAAASPEGRPPQP